MERSACLYLRRVLIEHAQGKCGEQEESMDYDKIKALMGASREKSAGQPEPEPEVFPKPDSRSDWKYLDYVAREQMAV